MKIGTSIATVALALAPLSAVAQTTTHTGDTIIQGSNCTGQDCVTSESFGFDTIRIKENNLRFHAEDTSNSASFPTSDWRLLFNDSSNGGANHFSIHDNDAATTPVRVEATAPTDSLVVNDDGRIGFGTQEPVVELHTVDGNTPTLRLEQDGSDGFTPQTWDLGGNESNFFLRDATNGSALIFRVYPGDFEDTLVLLNGRGGVGTNKPLMPVHVSESYTPVVRLGQTAGGFAAQDWDIGGNETNFFIRDSTDPDNKLPLRIRPGTPTNTLILSADASGRVGMGTDTPGSQLHVYGVDGVTHAHFQEDSTTTAGRTVVSVSNNGASRLMLENTGSSNEWYMLADASNLFAIADSTAGTPELELDGSGNLTIVGTLSSGSDVNSKRNITPVDGADVLDRLEQVPVSEWTYNADSAPVRHVGPMAQDFHAAFGLGDDDRRIAATDMAGVALAGVKQLHDEIRARDAALAQKDAELEAMAARLDQLERTMKRLTGATK